MKDLDWEEFGEGGLEEWVDGQVVPVKWLCRVTKAITLTDWEEVMALDDLHIWTEEVVRERFEWEMKGMKGLSLHVAFVETQTLNEPREFIYTKGKYGGCRSWLEL